MPVTTSTVTSINSGITTTISSGGGVQDIASGVFVSGSGTELQITHGGTAMATTVLSGGYMDVNPLGVASGTVVDGGGVISGAEEDVFGGSDVAATVYSGAIQSVGFGGTATDGVISSGGTQEVSYYGSAVNAAIDGGTQLVDGLGNAVDATVSGGGAEIVNAGTAYGTLVLNGGSETVAGGFSSGATVNSGGVENVDAGTEFGGWVRGGAIQNVSGTGTTTNITVSSGGNQYVLSGGWTAQTTVSSGGAETVSSGGLAQGATIRAGAVETIENQGTTEGSVISGVQHINSGGVSQNAAVTGTEFISAGAIADGTFTGNGGKDYVQSGGTASGTTIIGGDQVVSSGAIVGGTVAEFGGREDLLAGASVSGTILSGGAQYVSSGATASGTTVSGGTQYVLSSGVANATTVLSGGTQFIFNGGTASGTTVNSSGIETVQGVASGTTVNYGGTDVVNAGGSVVSTTVTNGGTETLQGGTASNTTVDGSASQVVSAGGIALNTSLGGIQTISSGGVASGTSVVGGVEYVLSSGSANATTVAAGGSQVVSGAGVASSTVVSSGGLVSAVAGGLISGTTLGNGASAVIDTGGIARNLAIGSGGTDTVLSGGVVSGSVVGASGTEIVFASGSASNTLVSSGGAQVLSGGSASGTTVSAGGSETVSSGGQAIAGSVASGATLAVFSGGSAASNTIDGSAVVYGGGSATSAMVGQGGGIVVSSGGVARFTQVISGTELVSSGGSAVSATLSGANATEIVYAGGTTTGTFVNGGTQTVSGIASGTIVSAGGQQNVLSGGVTSGSIVRSGGQQLVASGGIASGMTVSSGGAMLVSSGGTAADVVVAGGTIINSGLIDASAPNGSAITGSGGFATIVNAGTIVGGGVGIALSSGGMVTNAGTIIGNGGTAITFGSGNSTLVLDTGSIISGVVSAAGSTNTLELTGSGTLSNYDTSYVGFQTLQVDPASTWELAGTVTLGSGTTVSDSGTLVVETGDQLRINGSVSGTAGTLQVDQGGTLVLSGAVTAGETVAVANTTNSAGADSTVVLGDPAAFAGIISGLTRGDTIDFSTLGSSGTTATTSGSTLAIHNGGTLYTIDLNAPIAGSALQLTSDGQGGTDLRLVPPVTEALVDDSGTSASDGITNDPAVTGTADPNSTVFFTEGVTPLGSATANGDGVYTFTPVGLPDGGHTITATQTDSGGNIGSAVLSFTLDTGTPDTPAALTLAPASDSGVVGDDITDVTTPMITGSGDNGDVVSLYDGSVLIGTGTVSGGSWSIATAALADGSHALTATETDIAGNVSAVSGPLDLSIDTTVPAAPGALALDPASDSGVAGDDVTNVTTPQIDGTGSDGDVVNLYDGSLLLGTGTVSGGSWSIGTSALADGSHTLTATETDVAGNLSSASGPLDLTIDTTAPAAPAGLTLDPASDSGVAGDDVTNVTTPVIDGSGGDGDVVSLYDGSVLLGTGTVSGGSWSITTSALVDGSHTLTAIETDFVGNISPASGPLDLTIDTSTPAAPADLTLDAASDSGVAGDDVTNVTTPVIDGSGSNGDVVSLYDGSVLLGTGTVSGGSWSITTSALVDGSYTLTATETDFVGNIAPASGPLDLTIDTSAPAAPADLTLDAANDSGVAGDDVTNVTTPVIDGSGSNGDVVGLYDGSVLLGTGTVSGGSWSITTSPLVDGSYTLTATETDFVGNTSPASGPLDLTIDTITPDAPADLALAAASDSGVAGDDITNVTTPMITRSGDDGDVVSLYDGSVLLGTGSVSGGSWSITTSPLADGSYTLTAIETDVAANTSPVSAPLDLTIDTAIPAVPTDLTLDPASDTGVIGDDITAITAPVIDGLGGDGDVISLYDGSVLVATGSVSGGSWSIATSALANGVHTLTATETDVAGNTSPASGPLDLTIDATAPAPTNLTLAPASDSGIAGDDVTNVTTPVITGGGGDGDVVQLYDGSVLIGTGTVSGGSWSITTSALADGSHTLTATETNAGANTSPVSSPLDLTIDTTVPPAPAGLALDPASDSGLIGDDVTNVTTPQIDGSGTSGDLVSLYQGSVLIGTGSVSSGSWSIVSSALADGSYTLTATETDFAGNVSPASDPLGLTIDTAAPAAPTGLTLDAASDSGVVGDDLTNVTTPVIDGTGSNGDLVGLYDGSVLLGTGSVSDGSWSITTSALADGTHTLTATETGFAGNISPASGPLDLTIETAAAAPTGLALAPASDSGVAGDDITNVTTPMIIGSGGNGDVVSLYDGSVLLGSGTVSAGSWSITTSALADGGHTLTAIETDVAANISPASEPLDLTIDTTIPPAPTDLTLDPASDSGVVGDDVTNVTTPVIDGSGTDGDMVSLYDGSVLIGTGSVSGGSWAITASALASGSHTLTAIETDVAANTSAASGPLDLTIDTTAPAAPAGLTLDSTSDSGVVGDDLTNVTAPVIDGTGSNGDVVSVYDGSVLIGTGSVSDGSWSITTSALADGTHTLTATETDFAGNISPASGPLDLTIETATAAPTGLALAPASDSGVAGDNITNVTTPVIIGSGGNGDVVSLYDGSVLLGSGTVSAGSWSITTTALADGGHTLTAIETDVAANISPASAPLDLTIDTTMPAAPATLALAPASDSGVVGDDVTNVTTPVIDGSGTNGDVVHLYDGSVLVGTGTVSGGSWSITTTALANGSHTLTATETDVAANTSSASGPLDLTIDTTVPAAPGTPVLDPSTDSGIPGDDLTNVTVPLIDGSGSNGDVVSLYDGSVLVGTGTVSGGSWSITTSALASGSHTLTATETDFAGNISPASGPLDLTIGTAPTPAPSALALAPVSDSGIQGDHITNVTQPEITGTGTTDGDTIILYNGNAVAGAGIVADGVWAITPFASLTPGVHGFTAKETDAAGNTSTISAVLLVTIDTTLPASPVALTLAAASDSGVLGDDVTNVTTPVIDGSGANGDVVHLYDGSVLIGTGTVSGGSWSITTSALASGGHTLTATETDFVGNTSPASGPLDLTIDATAPAAPTALALASASDSGIVGDDTTNVTTPVIDGTGANGDVVHLYDGSLLIGTGTVSGGSWSITTSALASGGHTLTATETDVAANISPASAPLDLTIDATEPAAPAGLALASGSDTGVVGDDITAITTPVIDGTGANGDVVSLYDGSALIGTGTVSGGSWSITTSALASGGHTLTATETDVAANISPASGPLDLTIDATAPAAPTALALASGSDSGVVGDDITAITTPVIDGTGANGDVVQLYDGSVLIGTGTVSAGNWSITTSALASGAHTLTATETDFVGNTSAASGPLDLTIDATAPAAPTALALAAGSDSGVVGDDTTNITTPVIDGSGSNGDVVQLYDGSVLIGSGTVSGGSWSITTSALANGGHILAATETDFVGNTSPASGPLDLTIDATAPAAPTALALAAASDSGVVGDDATNVTTPVIDGTGANGDVVHLYDGSLLIGTGTVSGGSWSITTNALASGGHTLTATETDFVGNTSAASGPLDLTIDATAPAAPTALALAAGSDSGVVGDDTTNITTPVIDGSGTNGDVVQLYDGSALIGSGTVSGGSWSITTSALASGSHTLTATETDFVGNTSAASGPLDLTIDTAAPAAPTALALASASDSGVVGDDTTNVTTPVIDGTGANGDVVHLYDGSLLIGTGTVSGGSWSITTSALASGGHTLTATETDVAANISPASAPLDLTIDATEPAAPAGLALASGSDTGVVGDDITAITTPVIDGTGANGDVVSLYDGSALIGTGTVSGGSWSITTSALASGGHTLTATETDVAANISPASGPLDLTIDATAPAAPTALALASGSDSGVVGDDITAITTPVIDGTGANGDVVQLYDGSVLIGTGTVSAGNWSITTSALASGGHTLTATETDFVGNTSAASGPLDLTIDATAPAAPTALALAAGSDSGVVGDDTTNITTPVIDGSGTIGDVVQLYDGSVLIGSGTVSGGSWSITTSALANGGHILAATETDFVGNTSPASGPLDLTIDATAPAAPTALALASASDSGIVGDGTTNVTAPVIDGSGANGDVVHLYDGSVLIGTGTVSGGSWSITTSALASGGHTLTATETDVAANISPASAPLDLTIDTTTPAAPAGLALASGSDSGVVGDDTTNITTPVIDGSGTNGDVVQLYDGSALIGSGTVSGGSWSITTSALASGSHTLTATETDFVGNTSAASGPLDLTIDTAAPAAPTALALASASDTGVVGDDITAITTPVIDGTGTNGDVVQLYDGSVLIGSGTVSGGSWSIATSALANGGHILAATETDFVGNTSAASGPLDLTIDTTAPAAPTALALASASDSGVVGDDTTNVTTPVIDGTGANGDVVHLYDGSVLIGTGTVSGGSWSITTSALANGGHTLTATETDFVGNTSAASGPLDLTIDTIAPAAPTALALASASDSGVVGDDTTNVTTPVIDGTGANGDVVHLYDGSLLIGTGTVSGGSWSITTSALANGGHTLTATETDVAANISPASGPLDLTIDATAPAAPTALALAAGSDSGVVGDDTTNITTPVIDGTGANGDVVHLYDGSVLIGTGTASGGSWSITTSALASGGHILAATETDFVGNTSPASGPLDLTIDATASAAPTVLALAAGSDSGVVGDDTTNVTTPVIDGTGANGDVVHLYDGSVLIGTGTVSGGSWSIATSALASGSHTLTATETDFVGNTSAASGPLDLTIDTAAPAAPAALALAAASDSGVVGDDATNVTTPVIDGTGSNGDVVHLYDGSVLIGTGTVSGGSWSITASALASGGHTLTATETDVAANTSPASSPLDLTIDTTAPAAPAALALASASDSGVVGDHITNVTTPVIDGIGANGDVVHLYDGSALIGTGTVSGGSWSITTSTLASGGHTLTATETDFVGNTSDASGPLDLTIDIAAPPAPASLALAAGSDSGVVGDDVTNVTAPVIDGTGANGDVVHLYDGSVLIGTGTVSGGSWAITTIALASGGHTLTATETDFVGNMSPASGPLDLTIDTTAPLAPTALALASASDTGVVGDHITNVTTPVIDGTGANGDVVHLYDGSVLIGSGTVSGGSWAITTSALASGGHTLTTTETDFAGNISSGSSPLDLAIETAAAAPTALTLAAASDSGIVGDDITNVTTPVIDGSGANGDVVHLYDGSVLIGTGTVSGGSWSITTSALANGRHTLTATETDVAANTSPASGPLDLSIDTIAPDVTASLVANPLNAQSNGIVYADILSGGGDPNATVSIYQAATVVGTAQANAEGAWTFDPSSLTPGAYTLFASETDAAGNTGSTAATPLFVPDPNFSLSNLTADTAGLVLGVDYTGPLTYLQKEYGYDGPNNVVIAARVANAYIFGGSGEDALAAFAGSNVLVAGTGSNWLVGASGTDGGTDEFFLDARGTQATWDTLMNFHAGDLMTLWGFDSTAGTYSWVNNLGAPGYLGATLEVNPGNGNGVPAYVTFAGLSTGSATLSISTGTSGGVDYLQVLRTA